MEDLKAAVIGAGPVEDGIAQTCIRAGYEVVNIDFYVLALDKARSNIEELFDGKMAKGTIAEGEKAEIMGRLTHRCDFGDVESTGIAIEAVPGKMEIKEDTSKKADELTDPDIIIASNTSILSISETASTTGRADKMMGVRFFYPAPVMKLAESVRGIATSDDTYGKVGAFAIDVKKEVAGCPELPGFMVNRILVSMANEAALLAMEGCKPEDVNKTTKLGANHLMGSLELCDFVGVDIILTTIAGPYNGFRDNKYRPCPILENTVKAGHPGYKMGQGSCQYI